MKISLVTDEVSADVETAIELGLEWGVRDFELRGIGSQRAPFYSDYQQQRVRELIEAYEIRIVAISPGLFKMPYPPRERQRFSLQVIDSKNYEKWQAARGLLDYHLKEMLPASIDYARAVGAQRIIAFSFERGAAPPGLPPDEILELYRQAARQAGQAGLQLSIEVEAGYWADTGARTAEIMRAVGEPALGVNWDPGNAFDAGDMPFPDGYLAVRPWVQHVHFKDAIRSPAGTSRYAIEGDIDWEGQIQALRADGYQGCISVEPHMQPKVAAARAMTARLQGLVQLAEAANQPLKAKNPEEK